MYLWVTGGYALRVMRSMVKRGSTVTSGNRVLNSVKL